MTGEFRSDRRFRVLLLGAGSLLWVGVFVWIAVQWNTADDESQESTPENPVVKVPKIQIPEFQPYTLPDFELTAHTGRRVSRQDLLGRPWVASFIFTRCTGECKIIDKQMHGLQQVLKGTGIRLVTFTVDPKFDTRDILKRHADSLDADPDRWLFLTGPAETVFPLINTGFKITAKETTGDDLRPGFEVTHSQRILHVDPQGRVIGSYLGTNEYDMARLRQTLLEESEGGTKRPAAGTLHRGSKSAESGL